MAITDYGIKDIKFIEVVAWIEIILMIVSIIAIIVNVIQNPSNLLYGIIYAIVDIAIFSMATYSLTAVNRQRRLERFGEVREMMA